jgi:hypothetical protein
MRLERPMDITLIPREDGGLRVCSATEPGLILSGADPEKVLAGIWPALTALREHRNAELKAIILDSLKS